MRNFDRVDSGAIEGAGDCLDLIQAIPVPNRVHAIPERDILDVEAFSSRAVAHAAASIVSRSEEHTSELQSLMRISYAVFCLKKKQNNSRIHRLTSRGRRSE